MQILTVHNKLYMFMIPIARNSSRSLYFMKKIETKDWLASMCAQKTGQPCFLLSSALGISCPLLTGVESEKKPALVRTAGIHLFSNLKSSGRSHFTKFSMFLLRATRLGRGTSNSPYNPFTIWHIAGTDMRSTETGSPSLAPPKQGSWLI